MKKNINIIIAVLCTMLGISACSDMDEWKDTFLSDGVKVYTGKIDSVKVYAGHERVMVQGLFISDPKMTGCIIYWNSKADSVDIPVNKTSGVDTLREIINLPENLYNFEIYTYDKYGNRSVPVYASGESYGENYISLLNNRPLKSGIPVLASGKPTFSFLPVDMTLGPIHTVVQYTNTSDAQDTIHVATDQSDVVINNFKSGTSFTYWTEYVPETLCIDTFKCETTTVSEILNQIPLTYVACSDEEIEREGSNGWGKLTVDGDPNTYWHSDHSPHVPFPHWLSYDMGEAHNLYCFDVIGRSGNAGNQFKNFEIWGKMNESDDWQLIQSFVHSHYVNGETERFYFDKPVNTRYLKINMLDAWEGQPYTFLAEFMVYEK